jgi:hypothetical protein
LSFIFCDEENKWLRKVLAPLTPLSLSWSRC